MPRELLLRQLNDQQTGIITRITGNNQVNRRIREMGLCPGTKVQLLGRAPLMDPVYLKVRDNHMALRNSEADNILITLPE